MKEFSRSEPHACARAHTQTRSRNRDSCFFFLDQRLVYRQLNAFSKKCDSRPSQQIEKYPTNSIYTGETLAARGVRETDGCPDGPFYFRNRPFRGRNSLNVVRSPDSAQADGSRRHVAKTVAWSVQPDRFYFEKYYSRLGNSETTAMNVRPRTARTPETMKKNA